jgi:imidazolonepropionase-like amidohydrolase
MMRRNLWRKKTLSGAAIVGIASLALLGGTQLPTPSPLDGIAVEQLVRGPQGPPYVPREPIAIVGGLLIDATGGPARQDQTVLIEGERIAQIGPMEEVRIPLGAHVIDARGMTVMPGLIDSNQHMVLNPLFSTPDMSMGLEEFQRRWEHNWSQMEYVAFAYLMQGITGFRQTPGPADLELEVKRKIDRGEIPGPRVYLGGSLWMSEAHFQQHMESHDQRDPKAIEYIRHQFEYNVIKDVKNLDPNGWGQEGPDFNYWKLYMWEEPFDGKNDFTDEELRTIIARGHELGKIIDVHAGGHNNGLRRMLAFDVDTLEHPFYGNEIIEWDVINGYVKKGVIVDTLLEVMIQKIELAADPHRFSETLYSMSQWGRGKFDPYEEHRILMTYRDKLLWNQRNPDKPGLAPYPAKSTRVSSRTYHDQMKAMAISKENMRRFIKAGAKFWMGTDTGAFMTMRQEDPYAHELSHMVEMGMTPLQAIESATRNGAEGLGLLDQLGTIEKGKLADVIVVAGNPLKDMEKAMRRVYAVIKGGVRYK